MKWHDWIWPALLVYVIVAGAVLMILQYARANPIDGPTQGDIERSLRQAKEQRERGLACIEMLDKRNTHNQIPVAYPAPFLLGREADCKAADRAVKKTIPHLMIFYRAIFDYEPMGKVAIIKPPVHLHLCVPWDDWVWREGEELHVCFNRKEMTPHRFAEHVWDLQKAIYYDD